MLKLFLKLPLFPLILGSLTLGLAPFTPEPHLWQKLKMLAGGELNTVVDSFDLLMHGFMPALLLLRLLAALSAKNSSNVPKT
jgi:hypothetical protein